MATKIKFNFKKRYVAYAFLAAELASIPAAAQIIDRVVFSVEPKVTAVLIDEIPGQKRFAVASNSPFHLTANDLIGDVTVSVHKSGNIGTIRFGDNAQIPGPATQCSTLLTGTHTIYQSDKKTAINSGDIITQAVVVVVNYDTNAMPNVQVKVGESKALRAEQAECKSNLA